MSHVLNYDGQYFRIEITEVANADDPEKAAYISWCSDAFKELKEMPSQVVSRLVAGPPLPNSADALRCAYDWIKINWDAQQANRTHKVGDKSGLLYTVSLFKGDSPFEFEFEEFSDAKAFARAAEKSIEITKVGITNNESPQYLTVWKKAT
jgi:hypothetical protein